MPYTRSADSSDHFRPPLVSAVFSAFFLWVAWMLYAIAKSGLEIALFGVLACVVLGVQQGVKAVVDHERLVRHNRKRKRYDSLASEHAKSRWATPDDVRKSDHLSVEEGVFFGQLNRRSGRPVDVHAHRMEHVLCVGAPGTHKSTAIAMPLAFTDRTNKVLIDPTCEMLSVIGPVLEADGVEVVVATPYPETVEAVTGRSWNYVDVDIFSRITEETDPRLLSELLTSCLGYHMRGKPEMTENEKFFFRDGKNLHAKFAAMSEMLAGRKPTMAGIRSQLMRGPGELGDVYQEAIDSDGFGGAYAELGGALSGLLHRAGEQWAGGYGVAVQAFEPYEEGSRLADHTTGSGLDPRVLKQPGRKRALFVVHTLEYMTKNVEAIATTVTWLLEETASVGENSAPLTFVVDEAGSLFCPAIPESLLFYRKVKNRLLLLYQDVYGQAEKTNGKAGLQQIIAGCTWKIGMGIQEPQTLEMFSKMCGERVINDVALHDRSASSKRAADLGQGISHKAVRLASPDQLRMFSDDELLVVGANVHPMRLKKVPYYTRPEWARRAGPSPYV